MTGAGQHARHRQRVLRSRSAATADDGGIFVEQRGGALSEVVRGGRVQEAPTHLERAAGVRPGNDRHARHRRAHRAHDPERLGGSLPAVHPDRVGAQRREPFGHGRRRRVGEGPVVARERHRHDQRETRCHRHSRGDGLFDLREVGLRLDREQVRAPVRQRRRLFGVRLERLLPADPSERREPHAERSHRPGDDRSGLPRDRDTPDVQVGDAVGQAEPNQAEAVRAEGVRHHEARAGLDEARVHRGHRRGIGRVQRLEARIRSDPLRDQGGSHPAVREQRAGREQRRESRPVHAPYPRRAAECSGRRYPSRASPQPRTRPRRSDG